ncbi:hypothetical protein DFP72DRAFT_927297 [Ephemerocybe angulata]|uniref:Secreted protein n=1 Tax=Ephemerocybe angulata TaxID=980116 RepID=A0A8H6LY26_9AGAR|nr:hypothetical protein DFP72DRAFT_927297 [Tulosesus angulatus]
MYSCSGVPLSVAAFRSVLAVPVLAVARGACVKRADDRAPGDGCLDRRRGNGRETADAFGRACVCGQLGFTSGREAIEWWIF